MRLVRKRNHGWRFWLLWVVIAVGCGRLAAVRGLLVPIRIAGGSMAETLVGAHYALTCTDCGFPLRCDAEPPPETKQAVCPNCGRRHELAAPANRGQRVLIDRAAFWFRSPRRNELVAIRDPAQPDRWAVKRVVGLPAESLEIDRGDLLVGGVRYAKNLWEQRQHRVLVHDDRFRPASGESAFSRWKPERADSGWRAVPVGMEYAPPSGDGRLGKIAWLTYCHLATHAGPAQGGSTPILDDVAYNQGVSRKLNAVRDVMLAGRLTAAGGGGGGRIHFRFQQGNCRIVAALDFAAGRCLIDRPGASAVSKRSPSVRQDRELEVEYSLCDGHVLLAIDGHTIFHLACGTGNEPPNVEIGVGAEGCSVSLRELRVFRDRYYLPAAAGFGSDQSRRPLPAGGWCLLGDNPAVSVDSRHWIPAAAQNLQLLGRVLRWPRGGSATVGPRS